MGVVGYALKKFEFDPAPLVLGLVIAPIFEMSLRQSLIMSDGNWTIFVHAPDRRHADGRVRRLLLIARRCRCHPARSATGAPRWPRR